MNVVHQQLLASEKTENHFYICNTASCGGDIMMVIHELCRRWSCHFHTLSYCHCHKRNDIDNMIMQILKISHYRVATYDKEEEI